MAAKTNAVRMVERAKIQYKLYEYDAPEGFLDGVSVAEATGFAPEKVFKTLLTKGGSGEHYVCVIPVAKELNLKKAEKYFGEKKMEMLPSKDITKVTGYMKGGCSPIGMRKKFDTVVDWSAESLEKIVVSAGKVGLQIELSPRELLQITQGHLAELTGI